MTPPPELRFTREHEWISSISGPARVGVSAYAIEQLGDVVHIELPEVGAEFEKGSTFGTIESTKTVSDLYMPLAGKVIEVNNAMVRQPETLHHKGYRDGWLIKITIRPGVDTSHLLNAADYAAFVAEQDH